MLYRIFAAFAPVVRFAQTNSTDEGRLANLAEPTVERRLERRGRSRYA